MKDRNIDFMELDLATPAGGTRQTVVGFERDGTVWIQPDELGITPAQGEALMNYPKPWLIVDAVHGRAFLHWRAAAELIQPAERREMWLRFAKRMFQEYQRIQAHESARNN